MKSLSGVMVSLPVLGAALAAACGSGQSSEFQPQHDAGGHDATVLSDGGGNDGQVLTQDPIVSITITPANPTIVVANGVVPAPTTFTAKGTTMKGKTVTIGGGQWSYDRYDLGT